MPVGFVTSGRRLLIIGGGHETAVRVEHARQFDWRSVTVVAGALHEAWRAAAGDDPRFTFHARAPVEADIQAADLVIKDCPSREDNCQVVRWCHTHRVLLNSIDKPAQCDLYYASFFARGPLLVAILSGGHAPALTSVFRRWLERKVGPGWLLAACLMAEVRRRLPGGQARMDLLKKLARDEELLALIEAGDEGGIRGYFSDVFRGL
jgi:siroheme synthase-like protein